MTSVEMKCINKDEIVYVNKIFKSMEINKV